MGNRDVTFTDVYMDSPEDTQILRTITSKTARRLPQTSATYIWPRSLVLNDKFCQTANSALCLQYSVPAQREIV